ncbi:MAG TPA: protein translocase subunit SecD [Hyphomonadaceae bacterium]|jgi:protein-export membrane protein SecD|nr:protein translocase subunit SecD [Hyphomonadaceae bacterium]
MLLKFPAWKIVIVIAAVFLGIFFCIPNFFSEAGRAQYLSWFPTSAMKQGLDLKGGASILLEVDPDELRHNQLKQLNTRVRDALRAAPIIPVPAGGRKLNPETGLARELVVRTTNPADMESAKQRIQKLGNAPIGQVGQPNSLKVDTRADGAIVVSFTDAAFLKMKADTLKQSIEAVNRRVNASGLTEPNVQPQGDSRIIVEVPDMKADGMARLKSKLTEAGVLTFNLVDQQATADAQRDPTLWPIGETRSNRMALPDQSRNNETVVIDTDAIITGADLAGASQSFDQSNQPSITFQLHASGAQAFGKATAANVGRPFAIVLDDSVVSAPNIRSPITGGSGTIEGGFTVERAEDMAIVLRAGALPAKLKVASSNLIDASLGADSVRAGVTATLVGIIAITVFMIATYGLLGLFAVIAVYFNLAMMIGFLSAFGATMTLPGIAGILLTMGMAVDANVLINERIREEKKAGRSVVSSVDVGFDQAMATIIDANVTHLIAGIIMFSLGSGPIRGFALTLAVGILTSMFTSVLVARFIFALWLKYGRPKYIPI